mgnify:FL=1
METSKLVKAGACTLGRAFGYTPKVSIRLIEEAGSIEALFRLSERERDSLLGPFSRFRGSLSDAEVIRSGRELDALRTKGIDFIALGETGYPQALAECPDCPAGLYVISPSSPEELFDDSPFISIVGTRDISLYGQEWTRRIVFTLSQAQRKPVIVSGLAYGVDICAHRAALEAGLRTIAVIPTGPEAIYPQGNARDAPTSGSAQRSSLSKEIPIRRKNS